MFVPPPVLRRFRTAENGAISVDYVVITALAMGVAVAASEELMDGMGTLAGTVDDELSGTDVETDGTLTYNDGFDNGAGGWSGVQVTDMFGIGKVLGPVAGSGGTASVTRTFEVDPDGEGATIQFDLLALDGLEGESGYIYIDGQAVGYVTSELGTTTITPIDVPGIEMTGSVIDNAVELGGHHINTSTSLDSRSSIMISMADASGEVTFGFGSDAVGTVTEGSFALDNFKMTGLLDPDKASGAQVADAGGGDAQTGSR